MTDDFHLVFDVIYYCNSSMVFATYEINWNTPTCTCINYIIHKNGTMCV